MTKILIIGSGAIGSFYGSILHRGGAEVSYVCRSDYEAIKKDGVTINSEKLPAQFHPAQVIKSAEEYNGDADYVVVATKVLPEIDATAMIKNAVSKDTAIVLLQNGVNIENKIQHDFPNNEIISGLAFICVNRTAPGVTHHIDYGRLAIGHFPEKVTEKTELFQQLLEKGGIECTVEEDVVAARWRKLLWNAPFNPISVLAGGADTREMTSHEPTIELVREVMKEVYELAKADGHPVPYEAIEKNIADTHKMNPYKTSMLLDYEAKRPMEVEAILGSTVRHAKKLGVAIPHIESLYGILSLLDKINQGKA